MLQMLSGSCIPCKNGYLLQDDSSKIQFSVSACLLFLLQRENGQHYIVPVHKQQEDQSGFLLWILPQEIESDVSCFLIRVAENDIHIACKYDRLEITVQQKECTAFTEKNRPRCDVFGTPFSFQVENGIEFEKTLSAFYWDSILPMTAERILPHNSRYQDGYVLSTLQENAYPSTYPDVDHEFQIKGRIALGDQLSLDIVRRMIELQLTVMRKDPSGRWRNPCAIRRNGYCEYHVPRRSKNLRKRALMFLLTGNIEVIESAWLYLSRTKDTAWLQEHILDFECAISLVERYIDKDFRLWSEVYFEDQVIKHGRETIAQAFAINSFRLLARMERLLGRDEQASRFDHIASGLSDTLVSSFPLGYWDSKNHRFLDWVDRKGNEHDHIHLLANELPVLFGCADQLQAEEVLRLIIKHDDVFLKFPSFVAARIEDYTPDEIGSGGPYDLCAAGRYWCWDAAYRRMNRDSNTIFTQLTQIANQAQMDGYRMGERYDMNYVYYQSEKNWHGAAHYYEYPNVFAWVLLHEYIGIRPHNEFDYLVSPCLKGHGSIRYGEIAYTVSKDSFVLTNAGSRAIVIDIDLSYVWASASNQPNLSPTRLNPGESIEIKR
jgi:hypothetical protein